jgi:diguanylate cyclase (GGDEF)-like protein
MSLLLESAIRSDTAPVRILHLEDNAADRELVSALLTDAGLNCDIKAVETRVEFSRAVNDQVWDLILSDYVLPMFDGVQALAIATSVCPNTPFIFVTGALGEDIAVESLKSGATDFVLKRNLSRLELAVRRALDERAERLRRQRAEEKLEQSEAQLRHLAYHDSLTGLPNRAFLEDRLPNTLLTASRNSQKAALLFIDLDNFKSINDSLGHAIGDLILKHAGERLLKTARANDIVARLGGDEFVVVLCGMNENTDAALAANRIREAINLDFFEQGHLINTTCSIGISVFPDDGSDGAALLQKADIALFSAKAAGRNSWQFITQEMNARAQERINLETSLRLALDSHQFFLEYQAQVELSSGNIIAAEALLRWRHPELGVVGPNIFIPLAESRGEIIRIGEWVLRTACAQARLWHEQGVAPLGIAVNVSSIQFRQDGFLQIVKNVLAETGLPPECLELELTESIFLAPDRKMISRLHELRKLGVKLAIDDFGTGYCSFGYLRRFRFSKLKIDGSFVKTISDDADAAAVITAMISMGKILQMTITAECVETKQQEEFLLSIGCDQMQGYFFSRPLAASAFAEFMRLHQLSSPALRP